mmetsp:Transcript_4323/g.13957  ORF Transcript_4323/g.13957 Transcript_4323/m.13957 type:complete len:98 (-) Transcript_4323:910-1203(-)
MVLSVERLGFIEAESAARAEITIVFDERAPSRGALGGLRAHTFGLAEDSGPLGRATLSIFTHEIERGFCGGWHLDRTGTVCTDCPRRVEAPNGHGFY